MACVSNISLAPSPPVLPTGQVLLMVFSWTSIVLYAFLVYILANKSKKYPALNSPFYTIVKYNAIGDFAMFFHVEFIMRGRKYRFFEFFNMNTPSWLIYYSYFMLLVFGNVMFLGYIPMAVNRFTAFYTPLRYAKIWTPKLVRGMMAIIWILAILLTLPGFVFQETDIVFCLLPNGILQMLGGSVSRYDSLLVICVTSCVVVICITLYAMAIYKAKTSKAASSTSANLLEKKLLICSLLTFIPLLLECCRSLLQMYAELTDNIGLLILSFNIWFYLLEIMTSVQFWTILFVTPRVRAALVNTVMATDHQEVINIRIETTSQRMRMTSKP